MAGLEHVIVSALWPGCYRQGNRVATRWTFHGRHLGVYNGIAPTGLAVSFSAVSLEYIQDGLITDEWFVGDMRDMMMRILNASAP